ncbi:MAG: D-cysteine desulfhydrase family protein [Thermomicrobiales bacterium]
MRLATFPRFPLTTTPTPLTRALNLERSLGGAATRIYLKRDDLTGLAFGGNKARKLEYLVAAALAEGATTLVTEGAVQSNHARMTAAAAVIAGLKCTLILDARHGREVQGNLLLDALMGVDVRIVDGREERRAAMAAIGDELRERGERPYMIPSGGSVPLGALGYVACVQEIVEQLMAIGDAPSRLYFPTGSLGTQAGLVVGARAFHAPFKPFGIAVESTTEALRADAVPLARKTAHLIGLNVEIDDGDVRIDDGFVGPGYGVPTPDGIEAIRLLARTEAVFLDPVYTGKAMAGLLSHVRTGDLSPDDAIIFVHTGGGPSIFANVDVLTRSID